MLNDEILEKRNILFYKLRQNLIYCKNIIFLFSTKKYVYICTFPIYTKRGTFLHYSIFGLSIFYSFDKHVIKDLIASMIFFCSHLDQYKKWKIQ